MRFRGVLFDLFETLIPPFRRREHTDTIRVCASHLGVDFEDCYRKWGETFLQRIRGEFASIADGFAQIARQLGRQVSGQSLSRAEKAYRQFTFEGLRPVEGAVETLDWLVSRGVRIGLVKNRAPDIPLVWPQSVFAELDLLPERTLYVGDGSDEELSGAARCGLNPVLVRVDLSNTYDIQRKDVESWKGPVIQRISEVTQMLT